MSELPVTLLPQIRLPELHRISWSPGEARQVWEPRFRQIAECGIALAAQALERRLTHVVAFAVMPDRVFEFRTRVRRLGLCAQRVSDLPPGILPWRLPSKYSGCRLSTESFLVSAHEGVSVTERDANMPACCMAALTEAAAWRAPWWRMAARAAVEGGRFPALQLECRAERTGLLLAHCLGLPHLWYAPCRFDCPDSWVRERALFALMETLGYSEEAGWLRTLGDWQVEWSALHGIAEIKAPFFKLITNADATAEKLVVRLAGTLPELAAHGIRFPYRPHRSRPTSPVPAAP